MATPLLITEFDTELDIELDYHRHRHSAVDVHDENRYAAFRERVLLPLNSAYIHTPYDKWGPLHQTLHIVLDGTLTVEQIRDLPTWRAVWRAMPPHQHNLDDDALEDMAAHVRLLLSMPPDHTP